MERPRFLVFAIPGLIPGFLAAAALAAGAPPVSLIAIIAITYALVLGAYFSERIATPSIITRGAEAIARNARAIGIALTRRVSYRGPRKTLQIMSSSGRCPLGLDAGATWEIGESGQLDRPICRPAALAMGFVLDDHDANAEQACVCSKGPQTVSFAVRSK